MSKRTVATTPITNAHNGPVPGMPSIPANGAADVIIVLGGGVRYDGRLTEVSRARVECALGLYRAGVAPRLIMTGKSGLLLSKPVSEADAMAAHARAHDVPETALLVEQRARDTYGNARFTHERYLAPNRWQRVHIVTSHFHRQRAKLLFGAVLGAEYDCSYTLVASGASPAELALRLLEPIKLTFLPHIRLRAPR
jgi:uncharacterized SAM-binding protein YcdF (DUF218 family)